MSRALQRADPAFARGQPVGIVAQDALDGARDGGYGVPGAVRADGSKIRPACTFPRARNSAASGRKSLMLLVMTARPSLHAVSKSAEAA